MSDGIFARLRRRLFPSGGRDARAPAEVASRPAVAAEEVAAPVAERESLRVDAPERRLPPRPAHDACGKPGPRTASELDAGPAEPLRLTLGEAIALVQEGGGDAIELHFLRRELERRSREGQEPGDLWARVEQKVHSRLRRMGRLADGQTVVLERSV